MLIKHLGLWSFSALLAAGIGYSLVSQGERIGTASQTDNQPFVLDKSIPPLAPGEPPKLLFSDLTHAPNQGWSKAEPDKGAAVSIWGRGFGDQRNGSFVTVNGVKLTKDSDYAEWNADSNDVYFLKRTTFWLHSKCQDGAGTITVTTGGIESNAIPFTVIKGRIRFVDKDHGSPGNGTLENPWNNPDHKVINKLRPGDILYFRETDEPYNKRYLGGHQTFYLSGAAAGMVDRPIAVVSYPGEVCEIVAEKDGENDSCWHLARGNWTVAKFKMTSLYYSVAAWSGGTRVIGNDCTGCKKCRSGAGIIFTNSSRHDVLGNSAHGGRSENKLDHAIYVSGNASSHLGANVGWNYIYDNNFVAGPMLVINHQGKRIPPDKSCKRHVIHHNLVDCSTHHGRGIGIYSMSWDNQPGEVQPDRAFVYNNILMGAGLQSSTNGAMYCMNGKASFLNNTLIDCQQYAVTVGGKGVISLVVENNVFNMDQGAGYFYIVPGSEGLVIDNNLYDGLGKGPKSDTHAINTKSKLDRFLIPVAGGPEVDSGKNLIEITDDFWGTKRPVGAAYDVGACEFQKSVETNK